MEWNTKLWENVDIDGSFSLSGAIGGSGGSVSTKSSISASTESAFKDCFKGSNDSFEGFRSFPDSYSKKTASVCSSEPFIGLKLGKRMYFESVYANNSKKKISSVLDSGKKVKSSCQSAPIPRCQVEGCNLDLSSAKEYHRKHRVCETHSKCPKVIVDGVERRFCQQCSRFHGMSEFDEEKRSCRKRLSDHNARRRKPQPDPIYFNSTSPYSSLCGAESIDMLSHTTRVPQPNALNPLPRNRSVPSKGPRVEIFDQGFKESLSSNVDAVDIGRALSLLSNNTWGSFEHAQNPMHSNGQTMVQHGMQAGPHGSPLSSQEYWQPNQQSIDPHIQIFKPSYENSFLFHPSG